MNLARYDMLPLGLPAGEDGAARSLVGLDRIAARGRGCQLAGYREEALAPGRAAIGWKTLFHGYQPNRGVPGNLCRITQD